MTYPNENPRLPENINNAHESPMLDFLGLAAALLVFVLTISFAISLSAIWLGPKIPFAWEPNLAMTPTPASEDAQRVETYLTELTERLAAHSDSPLPVRLHWLPDLEEPNAFATAGGNIHVTGGLLKAVETENGLAMVLAHEYAHVELRHPAILMLEQLGHTLLYAFLGLGDSGAGVLAQNTGMASLMSFSRDMEREADQRAVELLIAEYGHAGGASELFNELEKTDVDGGHWSLLASHPDTSERLQFLQAQKKDGERRPLPAWLNEPGPETGI